MSNHVIIPSAGAKITSEQGLLKVPNNPIIPFIEGDGIGAVSYTHLTLPTTPYV